MKSLNFRLSRVRFAESVFACVRPPLIDAVRRRREAIVEQRQHAGQIIPDREKVEGRPERGGGGTDFFFPLRLGGVDDDNDDCDEAPLHD